MRLCFYNPHAVLGNTLFYTLFRIRRQNAKYDFYLDLLKEPYNAVIVVDGTASSVTAGSSLFTFISDNYIFMRIVSFIEIYIWCFMNGINPLKHKIIFSKKNLDETEDMLFGFPFLSDTFLNTKIYEKSIYKSYAGPKILHASHCFGNTKIISRQIEKSKTSVMVGEADLTKSPFFKKHFPFIKKVITVPFILRDRYKNITPFPKRESRAITMSIVIRMEKTFAGHKDFCDFFHSSALHSMRARLLREKDNLADVIECKIFEEEIVPVKGKFGNVLRILKQMIWPANPNGYYSFDIVEEYNKYQMFIAPEEDIGVPSVNFMEGMSAGCAFIGLRSHMYADLGMRDREHYIGYDGTLSDLKKKILYYRVHQNELKTIADNGMRFVKQRFVQKRILDEFWKDLQQSKKRKYTVK